MNYFARLRWKFHRFAKKLNIKHLLLNITGTQIAQTMRIAQIWCPLQSFDWLISRYKSAEICSIRVIRVKKNEEENTY